MCEMFWVDKYRIFTLKKTHENILRKYSNTCSKNLIGKYFFVELMYKNKYQKTKIKLYKDLIEANIYETGLLQTPSRGVCGEGGWGEGVAGGSGWLLPPTDFC